MPKEVTLRAPTRRTRPTFNARPVCAAGRADRSLSGPYATHYTAVASYCYITRQAGEDRFGPVPDGFLAKADLIASGRFHPVQRYPVELRDGPLLWQEADAAAAVRSPIEVAATHIVASLPPEADVQGWLRLIKRYCLDAFVERGMVVDWAVHAKADEQGRWRTLPHVHLLATTRFFRRNQRHGERHRAWLANAAQIAEAEAIWLRLSGLPPLMPAALIPSAQAAAITA